MTYFGCKSCNQLPKAIVKPNPCGWREEGVADTKTVRCGGFTALVSLEHYASVTEEKQIVFLSSSPNETAHLRLTRVLFVTFLSTLSLNII